MAVLLAAAAPLLVLFTVHAFLTGFPSHATRVTAPGSTTITLAEPGTYTISYEHQVTGEVDSSSNELGPPIEVAGLEMSVKSAETGSRVPVHAVSGSFSYQTGSTEGIGLAEFSIDRPGRYVLDSQFTTGGTGEPVTLAIAKGTQMDGVVYVLYIFAAIGLFIAAIAVAAITLFLRLRAADRARVARRAGPAPPATS